MKKAISILMALAVLLTAGCASKKPADAPAPDASPAAEGELSGTITVWSWDLALAYLRDVGGRFMEEHPNVTIEFEEMGTDQIYNKLTTSLATGAGLPDLVSIEGEQMPKFGNKFPDKFLDLTNDIKPADFLDIKLAEATANGKILAYPWDAAPCVMFYRTDMYEKAGVDAATILTWDDFIEAGKKVQAANPGVAMMPLATSRRDHIFRIMLLQQGKFYFDADGNSCLNTPEAIGAMQKVKDMHAAGITVNETDWDNYVTTIKEGKVASVPDGIWMAGTIRDLSPEDGGKWGVMPMPQYSETTTGAASNGGSILAIPASTQNPALAKAFAAYAMTDMEEQSYGLTKYALYPSYRPAFESEAFQQTDPYFSDAKLNELFSTVGAKVPSINYTENFSEAMETAKNAVAKILQENADVTETMNNLQKEFTSKFGK